MNLKPLLLLVAALSITFTAGISKAVDLSSIKMQSRFLESEVSLTISLPKNYDAKTAYPTLYLMDGQWLMTHALSIRTDLTERNGPERSPDFIIVGIETPNDKRWGWSMDDIERFIAFLKKELIVKIEKQYSTNGIRLIAGWEITGSAVIRILTKSPNLFSGYIAASPTPLYGSYFPQLETEHALMEASFSKLKNEGKFIFIGEAEEEYPAQYGIEKLLALLNSKAPKNMEWHHEVFKGVAHRESPYSTIHGALRKYFRYFGPLEFSSISEFRALGGMSYFDEFYEIRARKLKLADDHNEKHFTRRHLTLMAIGENNIEVFHELMTAFESDGLVQNSFVPHLNAYVQFYLKHQKIKDAETIASYMISQYPDKAMAQHAMGEVLHAKSNNNGAAEYYSRAVDLAEKNNDWMLEVYKKDLKKMK